MNIKQQAFILGYLGKEASSGIALGGARSPQPLNYRKFFDAIPEVQLPEGLRTPEGQATTPDTKFKQDMYLSHLGFELPKFRPVPFPVKFPVAYNKPQPQPQAPQPVMPSASPEEQVKSSSWGDTILDWLRSQLISQA
jgi:hypothetical protein